MANFPIPIKLEWVKGHQDASTPFRNLSVPAKLNCMADHEATLYEPPEHYVQNSVTPLPNTPCQIVIQGNSVTSKIKRRVHDAATIPVLMNHLREKFHWDQTTVHSIDWDTFTNILQKYKDKWTTIVKHVHNISPT